MTTKFLFATLAALSVVSASPVAIVGGTTAKVNDFTFIAAVVHNNTVHCGGSLLNPTTVLVAAQCLELPAKDLQILVGTHDINSGGFGSGVTKMFQHPQYNYKIADKDVGIIKLDTPIPSALNIKYPTLAAAGSDPVAGTVGKIAGWGDTQTSEKYPSVLREVDIPVIDRAKCAAMYKSNKNINAITENMFCAVAKSGGKDACTGDSGGPMIDASTGVLTGVASFGWQCARADSPGVYVRVGAVRDFIDKHL
ncbi:hypothetical protein EKO04_008625 [Ascochyta lentis]|uniref:Peptidase S1 domain-containing protein n=1 Tax=Ascochyta lentis TaxID=205686 RepID=A0A8H7IV25_9PLEO|nr:hypothetical protein EKO04_008625 [Ascochyta lentis]